jgi:hypothetical protein
MWKTVWTDADWIAHVRMSESTFVWLKAKLRPHLKMNTKFGRKAKSVGQQLAYALYHLASGCSMAVAAAALQTSKSTVHRCVHRVCDALVRELANQYICFPSTKAAMTRAASVFTQLGQGKGGTPNGLPQIIGAVDGTHIALRDPGKATNDPSWFNRKGYASKNVHAMCDGKGQFIHIAVGAKGSAHDSRVFKSMDLWEDITTGDLGKVMWDNSVNINGIRVPFCLIGDAAYPCTTFMLPAFKDSVADRSQRCRMFNYKHSVTRIVIERAFGRLKARWRALLKESDIREDNLDTVIQACFILHNICERKGEPLDEDDPLVVAIMQGYHDYMAAIRAMHAALQQPVHAAAQNANNNQGDDVDIPIQDGAQAHGVAVRQALTGFVNER